MKITRAEDVGMSTDRLARIDPVMEAFVHANKMPGILTLIQRGGEIVHLGKFGLMDIEAARPIQADALFRIFSMTKPIISVALMMLFEEGHFGLREPVKTFIPEFAETKVYGGAGHFEPKLVPQERPITLYHLLTHTSGLSYGFYQDSPVEEGYRQLFEGGNRQMLLPDVIAQIADQPLLFQPGTGWRYSMATDVLGYVIQVVSGMPLADFLAERIFRPLGMTDTFFTVPPDKVDRLAQLYYSEALDNPQPLAPEKVTGLWDVTTPTTCPSGGGGLVSSLADYLKFSTCLLNNGAYGGGRLLGRKTLAWMTADHVAGLPSYEPEPMGYGFGLGFRVLTDLGRESLLSSVGEYGWGGAAKTHFWIDPAEDMIGLLMTQYFPADPYPVHERFHALAYQAIVD